MMQPEDKIQEIAERAERLQEIGSSILRVARDELYLGMRFLDVALSSFSYQMDGQVRNDLEAFIQKLLVPDFF